MNRMRARPLSLAAAVLLTVMAWGGGWGNAPAHAVAAIELLEVTGTLERVAPDQNGGEVITLNVSGKEASGPLDPSCSFADERGQTVEKGDFLRRYMKRVVTLELEAESGVVVSCRVGS